MQVKFQTRTSRVKGLSFHPTRPWILASVYSGEIQLWDYRLGTIIEKFIEHEGPVRSVCFHHNQPLFVSGGDDTKIIGWNYKNKSRSFLLKGHLDFIRTVSFHHELPWVLSSSDDQTVRIWNYVNRMQLAILAGHNNMVMCAQFHPSKDLIVSCSLDQTVRLWDYTNLKNKYTSVKKDKSQDELSKQDVEIKAIMEGHDRGVNWCAFHPTANLIVSGADDRKVKLWKYGGESQGKGWEYDSLHGHSNNISCTVFFDKLGVILSNAEDKTIRVWDLNKRTCIDTFKLETDRYWILAMHPQLNFIAAGHDSGFSVFTLQSEKIPAVLSLSQNDAFYVERKQLVHRDLKNGKETILKVIDHNPTGTSLCYHQPSALQYNYFNNTSHNIIVQFKDKEKIYYKYFLYNFDFDISKAKHEANYTFRYCIGAAFVAKDKLAILSTSKEVGILETGGNLRNLPNLPLVDMIYPAGLGKLILRSESTAMLYDTTTRKMINQIEYFDIQRLKRAVWDSKFSRVALICKKTVYILNKSFSLLATIVEKFKVTSACWNNDGALIYTTKNHLKYALVNGDYGVLKCLSTPMYLIHVKDQEALTIDGEAKFEIMAFDREEYLFKMALLNRDTEKIKARMQHSKKLGNSLISYLYKKNFSAIALNMVTDVNARFSLALDSGNLEVSFQTCHEQLKDKASYMRLGEEALRQGNHQIVEIAYQQNRAYDKLSLLYAVTGDLTKLKKMLLVAQKREDIMSRFSNALFLGDVPERIRVLAEAGLTHLAYLSAKTYRINEMAEPLLEALDGQVPPLRANYRPAALVPLKPLILDPKSTPVALCNWPHNQLQEDDILLARDNNLEEEPKEVKGQELELNIDIDVREHNVKEEEEKGIDLDIDDAIGDTWGVEEVVDLPDEDFSTAKINQEAFSSLAESAPGKDPILEKAKNSQLVGELVACGEFESATGLLKRQIGVSNTEPFLSIFKKTFNSSRIKISGLPFTNPVELQLSEDGKRPYVMGSIKQLTTMLRAAYKLTTDGKFNEAINAFREILLHIPLLVLEDSQEEQDLYALIRICYNYIVMLRCEITKRQVQNDAVRTLELSAFMCCCSLETPHKILVLRNAMALAYKMQDFIYAAFFAKKVIQIAETNPNAIKADKLDNTKKVYASCEQKGTNEHTIDFEQSWLHDSDAVTKICAKSLTVIKTPNIKRDAFIKASYKPEYAGELDDIIGACTIGAECLGLKLY